VASGASLLAFVRAREATFFQDAERDLREALRDDRAMPPMMLDLLRAASLITAWLWGQARQSEAVIMNSTTMRCVTERLVSLMRRIAQSCGFDLIPSSAILPGPMPRARIRRKRKQVCPLPKTQIEIAERIYAL